ncbi:MAG: hypothetical protein NT075_34160 [Chloroflexi bacterium]|nr:hypothetical protein [Chloroflexota bacterium]
MMSIAVVKPWTPTGPDLQTVFAEYPDPLRALANTETPAIILRQVFDADHCQGLIQRFINWGLIRDPKANSADQRNRIDIGTSLGNRGHDQAEFLRHAIHTDKLFEHLFDDFDNPVKTLYDNLAALALDKEVKVAYEPDGRRYGPAIFRTHYTSHRYPPHIDSVRLREKRTNYSVYRFEHQFAGILCLQNATHGEHNSETILHKCLWEPEIQPYLAADTFNQYATENQIEHYSVALEPGDLYFFNTRCIHEIPALAGTQPRIVLAVFIGYSPEDNEIFVWA